MLAFLREEKPFFKMDSLICIILAWGRSNVWKAWGWFSLGRPLLFRLVGLAETETLGLQGIRIFPRTVLAADVSGWFVEIGIWESVLKTCVILGEGVVHNCFMLESFFLYWPAFSALKWVGSIFQIEEWAIPLGLAKQEYAHSWSWKTCSKGVSSWLN